MSLIGFLSATVYLKNVNKLLKFLGYHLGNKAIEIEVEAKGKKLRIQSSSQQELLAAIEAVKNLFVQKQLCQKHISFQKKYP